MRSSTTRRVTPPSRQSGGTKRLYSGGRVSAGDNFGCGGLQQPRADVHAVAIRAAVVDVENVQEEWCGVSGPAPPGGPGHQTVAAQGDPHPFRPTAVSGEVVREFLVEDVGKSGEEVEFVAPGDRAHGQVVLFHGQGTLR